MPTRHPDTVPWVEERVDAVVALYQPTKAGEALLRSLDLRQMEGDPGFFGSYGFNEWAGVGEEIGRASCRERVEISVGAGSLKKKK